LTVDRTRTSIVLAHHAHRCAAHGSAIATLRHQVTLLPRFSARAAIFNRCDSAVNALMTPL